MDMPTEYCESLVGYFLSQPLNVISSTAFLVTAFMSYRYLQKRNLSKLYILPILLGIIGLSSAWWHINNSPIGDILDTFSIVVFASVVAIFLLKRITNSKKQAGLYFAVLLVVGLLAERLEILNASLPYLVLLVGFIIFGMVYVKKFQRARTIFYFALGTFSLAILLRCVDIVLCPTLPQGTHFLWHILVALLGYQLITMLSHSNPSA